MADTPQTLLQDQYDTVLASNAHPPNYVNPAPLPRYNLVILGAGPAGLEAAQRAAQAGAAVALVEEGLLGGEQLGTGCVPSKSFIRSARAHGDVRMAGYYGVRVPEIIEGDFAGAMARLRRTRSVLSSRVSMRRLTGMGIHVFLGRGRFLDKDKVEVAGKILRFSRAMIATGSRPIIPPIDGLTRIGYLTSQTVFSLGRQPERLAVIGAGPVGCEMAQAFGRLGSEVTLIEREMQILPGEDGDACRILAGALQRNEVDVKLGAIVTHVRGTGPEKVVHLRIDGHSQQVAADEILVCMGRTPNIEDLALAAAGIEQDAEHGIIVDDSLCTSNRRIYAAGDVCTRERFAHAAVAMAQIVVRNALFFGRRRFSELTVPRCVYTDPEIARVGLCSDDARRRGCPVETYTVPFHAIDRAVIDGDEEGLLKIHVRKGTDRIIGAAIIGKQAADMISQITMAMVHKIGLRGIGRVIYPYPTHIEAIRTAAEACNRQTLGTAARVLLRRWLAWAR